jgi:hypothetical protein
VKTNPNTDQFNPKKDPSDFLEGGAADVADRTVKQQKVVESKVQTIESVWTLNKKIKICAPRGDVCDKHRQ